MQALLDFNYLVKSCYYLYNNRIDTCVTYFTDSDTTKKCWYWPDTDTDARIGAALLLKSVEYMLVLYRILAAIVVRSGVSWYLLLMR